MIFTGRLGRTVSHSRAVVYRAYFSLPGEFEMPYDEEWEIDESQLVIKDEPLGEGAFGLVMKAEAYDLPGFPKCHTVAVKMLKSK